MGRGEERGTPACGAGAESAWAEGRARAGAAVTGPAGGLCPVSPQPCRNQTYMLPTGAGMISVCSKGLEQASTGPSQSSCQGLPLSRGSVLKRQATDPDAIY